MQSRTARLSHFAVNVRRRISREQARQVDALCTYGYGGSGIERADGLLGAAAERAGGILAGIGCINPLWKIRCRRLHDLSLDAVSKHPRAPKAPEPSRESEEGLLMAIRTDDANR
jgi:hypothetical protein